MAEYLLTAELLLFAFGFKYIFTRDRLFGLFYLALIIYALPAQIGYLYFPEFSELIQAYFGEDVWFDATIIIMATLVLFLILFAFCREWLLKSIPFRVTASIHQKPRLRALVATAVVSVLTFYQISYLIINYDNISWATAQDEELTGSSVGYFIFIFIFKLTVAISIVLYVLVRQKIFALSRPFLRLLMATVLGLFIIISVRLGNRTDLLALTLGIAVFESSQIRFTPRIILKSLVAGAIVVTALSLVELGRYDTEKENSGLAAALIAKDYHAPAHMLFAAIAHDFIEPMEVVTSNTANALILLNYPYLQSTITDLFRPGIATRSAGYAFYVVTEGYAFMGMAGFLYNGLVLMLGMSLWKRIASTNLTRLNLFVLAIMGCMVVNLVRGQTSYFIKYLYTFVIPGIWLYNAMSGTRIRLRIHLNQRRLPNTPHAASRALQIKTL
jgi:hypothetical protein